MSIWKCKYHAVCQTVPYLPRVPALLLASSFTWPLKVVKTVLFCGWLWRRRVTLNCLCLKRCSVSSRALTRGKFCFCFCFFPHSWAAKWVRGVGRTTEGCCSTRWKQKIIAVIKTIICSTYNHIVSEKLSFLSKCITICKWGTVTCRTKYN